jgi:methylenetetrahydrofolate reductase (NADPH)
MFIIDKINGYKKEGKPFYSFEYFPPRTDAGLHNLYSRIDRMSGLEPAFIDITWGAGGTTKGTTLEIAKNAQNFFGLDVLMHLTCTNMAREEIRNVLTECKEHGIQNILALRGDPPSGEQEWTECDSGLTNSVELVKFIRDEFGDAFCIAVAAYPEGHPESSDKSYDLLRLKEKFDAGADLAITQLFYDLDEYADFIKKANELGIKQPIIPGILPIQNYSRFIRFTESLNTKVPEKILSNLKNVQSDDDQVQEYGVQVGVELSKALIEMGVPGLHFYTLNLETMVGRILEELGMLENCRNRRALPWRRSTRDDRQEEDVRPIYWSNRPKSYLSRTHSWDDYPNGRWGDSQSPTFGALEEYYRMRRGIKSAAIQEKRRKMWGEPQKPQDVASVFAEFCQGKITELPWCDTPIQAETGRISNEIVAMNQSGYWTINSQPAVNGAPSSDPDVGWGGPGGLVFQKAYAEFFTSPENFALLMEKIKDHPSMSYQAIRLGDELQTNANSVNALTWGVFPGKEVIQPTIADPESFMIWKDEAFELWRHEWQILYKEGTPSFQLLEEIRNSYYLVNIVENDFIHGDIFSLFR